MGGDKGRLLLASIPEFDQRLRDALSRQRDLLRRQDPDRVYVIGDQELTNAHFLEVVDRLLLGRTHTFVPETIPVAQPGEVKFTGYFTPELPASEVRTDRFRFPVLRRPSDDSLRSLARAELRAVPSERLDSLVIGWVEHPLSLYHMQLQGSGYLRYAHGRRQYVAFAGSNGLPLTPIARALAESDFDVPYRDVRSIRKWMGEDLSERTRVLDACANYVYFERADRAPAGAGGVSLTAMTSVAADPNYYPLGAVLIAAVPNPRKPGTTETRILLVQDVGAAVKGKNHLDLYTGIGDDALARAQYLSHYGEVYLLAPPSATASQTLL